MAAGTASSGNPWKSNNDPKDFVGCKIEIISNSDIRYVGTLYTFDPHASTISLKDVQSFGTESRRSGDQTVAPSNELYEYIVFRISDIKDLCVCEPPSPNSRRLSHVDSAIVNASDESQQSRSSSGFPRIRYAPEFMRSVNGNNSSWNENRGRSGSANNVSTSSGNLGSVGGGNGNNNNRNSGPQGNNRNGQNNNSNSSFRGGNRGGRGGNRGGMGGNNGSRGGYNNGNRRGAPVFPYPNQAGPQDWLTRYQKDMNLKAEFQNVNPDLSVLANIASSSELPADKVRDMMEGNWEAFLTAAELPGKTEKAPTSTKAEYKDGFFDSLTAPPPNPNEAMYNRRKDYETFGPANNNNNNNNNNGSGNNGRYNNNNNRQQSNQNQQPQQSNQTGRWGNNQGSNQRQQSGDGYGQNNSQGYNGRNGGDQGGYNNDNRGRYSGNNIRGNQHGRGGNNQQRGPGGFVNQRGGQRGYNGNLNSLLGSMNNGGGFTQRDLVIPASGSGGNGGNNWTFNQRTQAALWTPAVGLDLTQQSASATTWTFACNSPSISENGYDALSPSPVA